MKTDLSLCLGNRRRTASIIYGTSLDGSNDYWTRGADLTGVSDGKVGIIAAKVRFNGGNGTAQHIFKNAVNQPFLLLVRLNTNTVRIFGSDLVGTKTLRFDSTATITADGDYHTILLSWDVANDNNYMYIDDSSGISVDTSDDANIEYTTGEFSIGADPAGNNKSNMDLNALYVNLAEAMDMSQTSNRRKFFDASGNWVPARGTTAGGKEPTGSSPAIYLSRVNSEFGTNDGSGGNFSATGSPSTPAS